MFRPCHIISDLDFEGEVLLHVFHDHHEVRQLDAQRLLRIKRTANVRRGDIGSKDLNHQRLYLLVSYSLDVAVTDGDIPDLQRFAANAERVGGIGMG